MLPAQATLAEAATIIEDAVAQAVGAPQSRILVWDEQEQALLSRFGERYREYTRQTGLLLPRLR